MSSPVIDDLWDLDHPVLRVMRDRRSVGSIPGSRDPADGARLGLAVEGGGMRGVVSAAMLSTLEDLGMKNCFDAVYGSSSGAVNGAYFLAGHTWYNLSIYFDDLTTRNFVDFRRGFRGGNILNLGYAFNEVVGGSKPLDYAAVLTSPIPITVAVTAVDAGTTISPNSFGSEDELRSALVASAWLPIAVRGTALFNGMRCIDGGLLTPHAFELAVSDGCTHVLSLSTRPMGQYRNPSRIVRRALYLYLNRLAPRLGNAYLSSMTKRDENQRVLDLGRLESMAVPHILDLCPLPNESEVKRHELGTEVLIGAARHAVVVIYAAVERLTAVDILDGSLEAIPHIVPVHGAVNARAT